MFLPRTAFYAFNKTLSLKEIFTNHINRTQISSVETSGHERTQLDMSELLQKE